MIKYLKKHQLERITSVFTEKELFSILTWIGMVMDRKDSQLPNAFLPMDKIVCGRVTA